MLKKYLHLFSAFICEISLWHSGCFIMKDFLPLYAYYFPTEHLGSVSRNTLYLGWFETSAKQGGI